MNGRVIRWLGALLFLGLVFWLFPPFHVVRIASERTEHPMGFDPAAFATNYWQTKLLPACVGAPKLADVVQFLNRNPAAARQQFGHSPGLGSTTFFLVQGSGRVTAVEQEQVRVEGSVSIVEVALVIGPVFGNAVRDASGLLDGSAFPNSQDFNDISTELNRMVETQVLPGLRGSAAVGKAIGFSGCIELEDGPVPKVLQVIPIRIEWP